MGESKQEEIKYALVDFLYKDFDIINSLFAQVFKGNISSIEMAQTTNKAIKTFGSFNAMLANGEVGKEQTIENKTSKNIDLHDLKIINLFNSLELHVTDSLSDCKDNQIVLVRRK